MGTARPLSCRGLRLLRALCTGHPAGDSGGDLESSAAAAGHRFRQNTPPDPPLPSHLFSQVGTRGIVLKR